MNVPLYDIEILRLAASVPSRRLDAPMGSAERRSPACGSRVTVDVDLGEDGRVVAIGTAVHACALGQASAALLHAHAIGRTAVELAEARDRLAAYLAGEGSTPDWPGIHIFERALPYRGRHPAIRLAFEAAAEAAARAEAR